MNEKNEPLDHGQQALSKLFQACDLLSAALTHSDGDNGPEELAARTLTKGALSRIENAVSELDNVVPHPADEASGLPVAESWDDVPTERPLNEQLYEYSEQLGQLSRMVFVVGEADRVAGMPPLDMDAVMRIVEREAKRLEGLVEAAAGKVRRLEGAA